MSWARPILLAACAVLVLAWAGSAHAAPGDFTVTRDGLVVTVDMPEPAPFGSMLTFSCYVSRSAFGANGYQYSAFTSGSDSFNPSGQWTFEVPDNKEYVQFSVTGDWPDAPGWDSAFFANPGFVPNTVKLDASSIAALAAAIPTGSAGSLVTSDAPMPVSLVGPQASYLEIVSYSGALSLFLVSCLTAYVLSRGV